MEEIIPQSSQEPSQKFTKGKDQSWKRPYSLKPKPSEIIFSPIYGRPPTPEGPKEKIENLLLYIARLSTIPVLSSDGTLIDA